MSKEDKEIFEEAAKESIDEALKNALPKSVNNLPEKTEEELAVEILEEESGWNKLMKKMDGDFAERFSEEMEAMSGREFVRNYLKALEYTKPKMIRQELKPLDDEDSKTLTVVVKRSSHKYKEEDIEDVNPEEDE